MTRKKKWLIFGGAAIVLAAVAIFLGWRYLPWQKLMKRPTSEDVAFVNKQQGPGNAPFSLSFDFEVDPKAGIPDDIYQGIAHSGNFSTKTFGRNTFSVMFEKTVKDLNIRDMKAVALSAWVYVFPSKEEPEGSLVFTVTNTVGVNTLWKGVSLHGPYVQRDKWFKISGSFDLSDYQVRPDDKIQIYFWNNSDTKILTDDFYVVFGKESQRRGDSAMTDMTRGAYQPRLNIPPFPVTLLHRMETENDNMNSIDLTPNDKIVAGRFTGAPGGLDALFALHPDGMPVLYQYCSDAGFRSIPVDCPADLKKEIASMNVASVAFTGDGTDQLIFTGKEGIIIAGFEKGISPCAKDPAPAKLNVIWHSDGAAVNGVTYRRPGDVVPCDVNGDRMTELLIVSEAGSWALMKFAKGGWTEIANGKENKIGEWDDNYFDIAITAGPFLKGSTQDQVLTIFTDRAKKRVAYSLVRYNAAEKKFVKAFAGRQGTVGVTVGFDTLEPGDRFFFGQFRPGAGKTCLRYSREWRFDLKEIQFNDSTFVILDNVDFAGYDKDQNPKFYEALALVPGRLTDPALASFLVIARNCKDRNYKGGFCKEWEELPYLPGATRVYSFKQKTQP